MEQFNVWVTRNHFACNLIQVSDAATTDIYRLSGCTVFRRIGGSQFGRTISKAVCLKRYGFLPQPATCWNVWTDAKGNIQYREHPILEKYYGKSYKPKPIKSEREHYLS